MGIVGVYLYFVLALLSITQCCEIEEQRLVSETYACNKTQLIWTKEKCMLFFQCDKQIQRIVPSECVRNVTVSVRSCCVGYVMDEQTGHCRDVDECSIGNHDCAVRCVNTPGGFTCDCMSGFVLAEDRKNCIDINECDDHLIHNCSHSCKNSLGSYVCLCPGTMKLQADGRTCEESVAFVPRARAGGDLFVTSPSTNYSSPTVNYTEAFVVVSSFRVAEIPLLSNSHCVAVWVGGGFAIIFGIALVGFALFYRRRRNQWPWFRIKGSAVWKKPFGSSASNSVVDMINTSTRSKVLEDTITPSILGLDTSRARVFKRNPNAKASPFATVSNSKCTVAFSTCSAITGASSITLMCPNVIAGSDVTTQGTNSAHVSTALTERDANSHIYCELRENSIPLSSTPTTLLGDPKRPVSPCYASLPIAEVPLMLTPVTSPSPNETYSPASSNLRASTNVYNDA